MSMRARVHPSLLVAGAAALLLVLVLLVDGTRWAEIRITDSTQLVLGSHTVVNCIGSGHLVNCYVGGWPLAQYVVAVPFVAAGAADLTTLHVLAALSSLAVGGMLVLVAFPIRRLVGPEWSVVLAITLLTSPFLLYALLPFGEALSAFLTLAFVVAACARRPGWLLMTGLLAGVTKETLAPFVLVLGHDPPHRLPAAIHPGDGVTTRQRVERRADALGGAQPARTVGERGLLAFEVVE